ncbi:MAG: hypothetical protein Q9170_005394 [Blastenia crenularia]
MKRTNLLLAVFIFSIVSFLLYSIYLFFSRLYLSPVCNTPGPKLAIWSFWFEFYHDVVLRGRYTWQIAELHKQYGPIIRINPYEVHIDDPDFYDELYVSGGKRKTEQWSWTRQSITTSVADGEAPMPTSSPSNPSPVIQSCVDKLCSRLKEHKSAGQKVNLMHAFTAFTGDVVTEYSFPASYGLLDKCDFAPEYYELWMSILSGSHMLKQFPWIFPLMSSFPPWFVERYLPDMAVSYRWHKTWAEQIRNIKSREVDSEKRRGRPSIFETLLDSDLPPFDKSVSRLVEDAQTLVGAGSITTSLALALATYYIISDEDIETRLIDELTRAMPNPNTLISLTSLEQLPSLSATVLEALHISYGVSHRLQRVCPDQSITYNSYTLPPGTPIGMTSIHIHDNPLIFPDPRAFKPERWLPLETEGARLQKRFGGALRVVDTVWEKDVDLTCDIFTPAARKESKGIYVVIEGG